MRQNFGLDLKQIQKLVLTPELRQSIELLGINALDLNTFINEIALENPMLNVEEKSFDSIESQAEMHEVKREMLDKIESYDFSGYSAKNTDDEISPLQFAYREESIVDDLKFQFSFLKPCELEERIAEEIFNDLDSSGYLNSTPQEIADRLGISELCVKKVKCIINSLDPKGIGANDLRECLLLQTDDEVTKEIIIYNLEDIAQNKLNKIAKERNISIEEVVEKVDFIKNLNPRPGASYADNEPVKYIVPEAKIYKQDEKYIVHMENEFTPVLKINSHYKNMIKTADEETLKYLKEKLSSAEWVLNSITQRESTIKQILDELVIIQEDFLDNGIKSLKPLNQKDIADKLELSESTVSRVVNDKFVDTPQGIIEIKTFFSNVVNDSELSSSSIHQRIKEIIDNEDKKKPLSDAKIEKILKDENIEIARRTISKYREEMGIPKTSIRREF